MRNKFHVGLLLLCFFYFSPVYSSPTELYALKDSQAQQRFQQLNKTLRCLVCQNQDLADSHASLANDLRQQIYQQIQDGKTDQEIVGYLTSRYGDFILFKPPLKSTTYFLWFGPGLFLLIGLGFLWRCLRH